MSGNKIQSFIMETGGTTAEQQISMVDTLVEQIALSRNITKEKVLLKLLTQDLVLARKDIDVKNQSLILRFDKGARMAYLVQMVAIMHDKNTNKFRLDIETI